MTCYAVFVTDEHGYGIQIVRSMDSGHAKYIVSAERPSGRMSVIEATQLEGVNRTKVVLAWVEALDANTRPGGSPG